MLPHATFLLSALLLADAGGPLPDVNVRTQDCGRYALQMAAAQAGVQVSADRWAELLPPDRAPYSVEDLRRAAGAVGLRAVAVRWDDRKAADLSHPCVLHTKFSPDSERDDHFIMCFGGTGREVVVASFPADPLWVDRDKLESYWSGVALYVGHPGDEWLDRVAGRVSGRRAARWVPAVVVPVLVVGLLARRRGGHAPKPP